MGGKSAVGGGILSNAGILQFDHVIIQNNKAKGADIGKAGAAADGGDGGQALGGALPALEGRSAFRTASSSQSGGGRQRQRGRRRADCCPTVPASMAATRSLSRWASPWTSAASNAFMPARWISEL